MIEFEGYDIFHEGGMIPVTQEILNEIIANAPEGEALNLAEELRKRECYLELKCGEFNFSNNKNLYIDFSKIILEDALIKGLEMRSCIFDDTVLREVIFFDSEKVHHLNKDDGEALIDLTVKNEDVFSQNDLINRFDSSLNNSGVCFGLELEFARFASKRMDENGNFDIEQVSKEFFDKLNRKINQVDKSGNYKSPNNFLYRVMLFQNTEHLRDAMSTNMHKVNISDINRNGFFGAVPSEMRDSRVIGLIAGNHVVSIITTKNKDGQEAYSAHDVNYGKIENSNTQEGINAYVQQFLELKKENNAIYVNFDKIVKDMGLVPVRVNGEIVNSYNKYPVSVDGLENAMKKLSEGNSKYTSLVYNMIDTLIKDESSREDIIKRGAKLMNLSVKARNMEMLKRFTDLGVDPNSLSEGNSPLHLAVSDGNRKFLTKLISENAIDSIDINAKNSRLETPLHLAFSYGEHWGWVDKLLLERQDLNVNELNSLGDTVLHQVISSFGDSGLWAIKLLLTRDDLDVNALSAGGESPLHMAVKFNNIEVVKELLKSPRIDTSIKYQGKDVIDLAIEKKMEDILDVLIEKSQIDSSELINKFVCKGRYDLALKLVEKDTDIDFEKMYEKQTVLEYLITSPNKSNDVYNLIDLISQKSKNLDKQNEYGNPIIHLMSDSYDSKVLSILIKNGANIDAQDSEGNTLLMKAIDGENAILFEDLLKNSHNLFIQNKDRVSAFDFALRKKGDFLELLNEVDLNSSYKDEGGGSVFCYVCSLKDPEIVKIAIDALKKGINLSVEGNGGVSPFICAIHTRNYKV
ncbi:MAG: ankyrin repeat domain-containing protein, partial [Rickettsiaceae bacterium]|nr:ankyrin repeat domain-containing protein [Rickettsiaceae bacterium]